MTNSHNTNNTAPKVRVRQTTPCFLLEGYALYEGGDYKICELKGCEVKIKKRQVLIL